MKARLAVVLYFLAYAFLFFFNGAQIIFEEIIGLSLQWKLVLYILFWLWGIVLFKNDLLNQLKSFLSHKWKLVYLILGIFILQLASAIIFNWLSDSIMTVLHLQEEFLANDLRVSAVMIQMPLWATIPVMTFFGPMVEELIFRGIIQENLNEKISIWIAIIVQAVLLGLLHLHTVTLSQILLIFPHIGIGFVFGIVKYKYKNIWFTIFPHTLNNLIGLLSI
ncbi:MULTISPECIES: CPBP family intramembrane glutamic endopeptidase [Streptococcus]|uniref:CPBP family intramembrane glutamic endopeptidase n=1 Tax=Streptococcus caledonicus TaxID=2614158 RepID=A0ABW0UB08_9STRE|nr:type II CAAX endopeptidase family protein [Streptococcus sp. S784/96/1]